MKRKIIIVLIISLVLVSLMGVVLSVVKGSSNKEKPDDVITRLEQALGDEYKKQMQTELAGTIVYADGNGNEIKYHILKTTYYEADPAEVTGLNINALGLLFDPDRAKNSREMKIQDWDAALYEMGERSFLCWTYSPEVSYVLEYDPDAVPDEEIIKMAESAEPVESTKK